MTRETGGAGERREGKRGWRCDERVVGRLTSGQQGVKGGARGSGKKEGSGAEGGGRGDKRDGGAGETSGGKGTGGRDKWWWAKKRVYRTNVQ